MELSPLSETGFLGVLGLITAFLLKCCVTIETSRCSHIDICGIKCDRSVLSEEHIARIQEENKEEDIIENNL